MKARFTDVAFGTEEVTFFIKYDRLLPEGNEALFEDIVNAYGPVL